MKSTDETNPALQPINDLDQIIHSPTRLKILAFLSVLDSADFTFLLNQTGITRGNLSANLRKLEDAGYIDIQKEFIDRTPRTLARLTPEGHSALQTYKDNMRQVLDELLDN